jgi:hypothetical protein
MATPDRAEIGHKLRQHDNEFEAVYDMIVRVDGKVDALSTQMDARFEQTDAKVDALAASVDARFEQVDARFEQVDARFEQVIELLRNLRRDG